MSYGHRQDESVAPQQYVPPGNIANLARSLDERGPTSPVLTIQAQTEMLAKMTDQLHTSLSQLIDQLTGVTPPPGPAKAAPSIALPPHGESPLAVRLGSISREVFTAIERVNFVRGALEL